MKWRQCHGDMADERCCQRMFMPWLGASGNTASVLMIVYLHKCFEEIGIVNFPHIILLFSALLNTNDLKLYHSLFWDPRFYSILYQGQREFALLPHFLSFFQEQKGKHNSSTLSILAYPPSACCSPEGLLIISLWTKQFHREMGKIAHRGLIWEVMMGIHFLTFTACLVQLQIRPCNI